LKLLETIRFDQGEFSNLSFHQKRMDFSRSTLFASIDKIDLQRELHEWVSENPRSIAEGHVCKCRVIYDQVIREISLTPYDVMPIKSLKLVHGDDIDYRHKYADRNRLNYLYGLRDDCDDVLIVKNKLVTDTSYANILFFDGRNWHTPASPLLQGTQRSYLLSKGIIKKAAIHPKDLSNYQKARLINAMIRFEDELDIEIKKIKA
jgi:4-amino-4-deoxychorismate lyase